MNKNFEDFKEFIKGKNVALIGIGVSNIPLVDFLLNFGAKVTAFDSNDESYLGSIIGELNNKGVTTHLGKNYLDKLTGFDVIFKSPSMRIDCEALIKAKEEGTYITSEIEEFIRYCKGHIFAITGSDGKTTTTSITARLLEEEGYKTWIGGNIGTPLFTEVENIKEDDKVVLELSSFQLMTINLPVDVAIITNITPNHLDVHKDMDEYVEAKKNVFLYQNKDGLLVLNNDNKITKSFIGEQKGNVVLFSSKNTNVNGYCDNGYLYVNNEEVCHKDDVIIKGTHNLENFLAAFLAVKDFVSIETMRKVASTFKGVEHRCEFVRELNGVKYYNDSIASTPTRTLAGLKAFESEVTLIAGGYDKKVPFEPLALEGYKYIKNVILIGATKDIIKESFEKAAPVTNKNINIYMANTLEDAVLKAKEITTSGDIVALSPACASFDMFKNFMIRGNKFKEIVMSL